ncbi:unnamed protein product [Orchesella dallaii]|uniref:Uncharacterized protein n=1 Tax=Orchesella dallaii TaxID=48710 RepID=A0ABP1RIU5_9HEXA
MYSEDLNDLISYCRNENHESQDTINAFSHWILPFTFSLWIVCFIVLSIPGFVTYCLTKSVLDSVSVLIGVVGVVLKQYTNIVGKELLVFTSFFALIACSFYESQITSLAIVQLPPPIIQSLEELINKGYKILTTQEQEDFFVDLKLDFKIRNMLDVLNQSWYKYAGEYDDLWYVTDLEVKLLANSNGSQSYAEIKVEKVMPFNVWYKTELIRKYTGVSEYACYSIPDKIGTTQTNWNTNVKNRHWLQMSLSYMNAAGLPQIWDNWSYWWIRLHYIMNERELQEQGRWLGDSLFHEKELGPALIKIHELRGFLVLAFFPATLSIVLLVLEICRRIVENKNENKVVIIVPTTTRKTGRYAIAFRNCYGSLLKFVVIPQNCRRFPNDCHK